MEANSFRFQLPRVLLLCALIAGTVVLLEPLKSLVSNWDEIELGFSEAAAKLAVPFLVVFCAAAALGILASVFLPHHSIPLLLATYVGLWAQGSLFVWSYGSFDGSPIDWSEHSGKGVMELTVWASLFFLAFAKPDLVRGRAVLIAATVLALQLASFAGVVQRNEPLTPKIAEGYAVDDPGVSANLYSRELNVIVIVLDSFQGDYFPEAMRDPELGASLPPGLTYFRNAVSLYPITEFSLPSILTSRAVPDFVDQVAWMKEAMARSVPAVLADRGFDAILWGFSRHTDCRFAHTVYRCVSPSELASPTTGGHSSWREDVSDLVRIGMFRLSPHFLKPRVYDVGDWRIPGIYPALEDPALEAKEIDPRIKSHLHQDFAVFDSLIRYATAGSVAPRFRLLHFFAAHFPWTVDRNCDYATGRSRAIAIGAAQCSLSRVYAYLQRLDEIGVYDRSLIVIVGDHGNQYIPLDPSVADPPLPVATEPPPSDGYDGPDLPSRGVPLFLVKPIGERGPFRVSDLPVSLCDIPRSIFDALDMEGDFGCESIFSPEIADRVPRMHYRYQESKRKRPPEQLRSFGFEKFAVVGHSWLRESWRPVTDGTDSGVRSSTEPPP